MYRRISVRDLYRGFMKVMTHFCNHKDDHLANLGDWKWFAKVVSN